MSERYSGKFATKEDFIKWRKEHITKIGSRTRFKKGFKHTEKWKKHISELLKGRRFTQETRRKMGLWQLGENNNRWKGTNIKVICENCKIEFKKYKCYIKRHQHNFCSNKCFGVYVSKLYMGRKYPDFSGNKNPAWKGGKSFEPYSPSFNQQLKDKIRVRDNFICQKCGIPELECSRRLAIHHIDNDKKNNKESNLISLCISCNVKVEKNREHWKNYFCNLVKGEISNG